MKGRILDFSIQEARGVITGDDNKRYSFESHEWKEADFPVKGVEVDFDIDGDGCAIGVYRALKKSLGDTPTITSHLIHSKSVSDWNLLDYTFSAFGQKYATFSGRARRMEYWGVQLAIFLASLVIFFFAVICMLFTDSEEITGAMWVLGLLGLWTLTFCPFLAVSVRRLHDIGKSGAWFLIQFIPVLGPIIFLVLMCQDSVGDNEYGDRPK